MASRNHDRGAFAREVAEAICCVCQGHSNVDVCKPGNADASVIVMIKPDDNENCYAVTVTVGCEMDEGSRIMALDYIASTFAHAVCTDQHLRGRDAFPDALFKRAAAALGVRIN
jgi:hypothetical protein